MATVTWKKNSGGASSGNWTGTGHWSTGAVPTTGDDVVIPDLGAGPYTVTLNTITANLGSLTLSSSNATLAIDSSTPTDNLRVTNGIDLSGGGHITISSLHSIIAGSINLGASGSVIGAGLLNVSGNITGSGGQLQASGGTLTLAATVDSGVVLAIASASASDLKITGTATSAAAITLNNANQTLEVGASGASLTINAAQAVAGAHIKLGGGTLTDASGITVSSGDLIGYGTVSGPVTGSGSGVIKASGGTLDITGTLTGGSSLQIDTASASTLKVDGVGSTANALSITNANQTLEIGSTGSLTLSGTQTISLGTLKIDGTLTDSSGITLSGGTISGSGTLAANTDITGSGTVSLPISTAGTLTASGGTLDLIGTTTGRTLVIDSTSASTLKVDGSGSTASALSITNANQTLHIGATGSLTLSGTQTVSLGTLKIDGTLTDASGITLGGGTISGAGTLAANTNITGYGTVSLPISTVGTLTASGGTLDLTGTTTGRTLAINSASASVLKVGGAGSTAGALTLNNTNQTLEIGAGSAALTLSGAQTVAGGHIKLGGGALTDTSGITISSGDLTGFGTVAGTVLTTGTGTVKASGGTLDFTGAVAGTLQIDSTTASTLKIDHSGSLANAITLNNANQTLEIGAGSAALSILGVQIVSGGHIKLDGGTLTAAAGLSIGGGDLIGFGKVAAGTGASGTGVIKASGGTLEFTEILDGASALQIDSGSASVLKISGGGSAANALTLNNSNQTLEIGGSADLTITGAQTVAGGHIKLGGGTLTDASGITVTSGDLIGLGTVNGAVTGSGTGIIKASGGTLDITGTLTGGSSLQIDTSSASTLKVDGTGSTANALTLNNSNQTLEIGASAALTLSGAQTVNGGHIKLDGGTLTDASGITVSSGDLTGLGTVVAAVTGSGTGIIKASGGTLDITGMLTGGSSLQIDTSSASTLKVDGTGSTANAITLNNANQTLEIGSGSAALTLSGAQTVAGGHIKLDGGTLTDTAGIAVSSGDLVGFGTVAAAVTGSGTGIIKASGGTLDITGTLTGASSLQIDTASASTLKVDGVGSTANALSITSANQTLHIGATGGLTVTGTQTVSLGTLKIDGTLADASGITLSGGSISGSGTLAANSNVTGYGTISLTINTSGTITASGGTLDLTGTANGRTLVVDSTAASVLKIDDNGVVGTNAAPITLTSANQTLEIGPTGTLTISGLQSVAGGHLKLDGGTLTDLAGITVSSGDLIGFGMVYAVNVVASGAGVIRASSGTLGFSGNVTGGSALQIDTTSASVLKFNGVGSTANTLTLNNTNQTLEIGSDADLTISGAQTVAGGHIKLDGGYLWDSAGITVSGGDLFGLGFVAADLTGTGSGLIKASGGTLEVLGTLTGGSSLQIDTTSASVLKIDGSDSTANAITLNNGNQTLEIAGSADLTINGAQTVAGGHIKLDGGALIDASGITVSSGDLIGFGTVSGPTTGSGTGVIKASGGTLDLIGTVTGGSSLQIDTASASVLKIESSGSTASSLTLDNANQTLEIGASAALTLSGAQNVAGGHIKLDGGALTASSGLAITSGDLIGKGTLSGSVTTTGTSLITASGGTLKITDTVSAQTLAIDSSTASTLLIDDSNADVTVANAIAINSANQTLEVDGALTINAAESITNGTINIFGGHLTDSFGVTIGSGATLLGSGIVFGAVTGSGTSVIKASGTLDIKGTLTGGASLRIDSTHASTLLVDGSGSTANALTLNNTNQTLEIGSGGAALTLSGAQTVAGGHIKLDGGTLTDASGIAISSGDLIGLGTVAAAVTGSGTGIIKASGGTLDITGTLTGGSSLQIDTASASTLKVDGAGSTANALTLNNSNQTLEIGSGTAALTLSGAQSVAGGHIKLDGGTLTASGVTISSGDLVGFGTVAAAVTGSGTGVIKASGGTLDVTGTLTGGSSLQIDTASTSTLKVDGSGSIANALSITSVNQILTIGATGSLTISGTQTVSLGTLKIDGTLTDSSGITLAGGTITGAGTLAANTNITGFGMVSLPISTAGTLTASGGTLDLAGTTTGRTLVINSAAASVLKIDGAGSTANALTLNNANQTLEIGSGSAALTLSGAQTVAGGRIQLDGGTLTDTSGIMVSSGSLSGYGTVAAVVTSSGSGIIRASGGTLDITGTLTGGASLQIDSLPGSKLKIDGAGSTANAITLNNPNQTLEIGSGSAALTLSGAQTVIAGHIKLGGGTLTDSSGITVSSGDLIGYGMVAGPVTGSGTGVIKASGGTLDITGTLTGGSSLQIDTASASTLKIDGSGSTATTILLSNANQTLEIGSSAGLSITTALSLTGGTIKLDGGSLTDAAGISLGAAASLTGSGTVTTGTSGTTDFEGTGSVTASGGKLEFASRVDSTTATAFHIASASGNVLKFDSVVGTGAIIPTITFDGSGTGHGEILDLSSTTLANFHGKIAGFRAGEFIKVAAVTGVSLDPTGKNLTLFNGGTTLGTITFTTSYSGQTFNVVNGNEVVICFMPGTLIRTPDGERAVETFKAGDRVRTSDGRDAPVRWVGRQTVSRVFGDPMRVLPIRIRAGALGENVPVRDLLVSPDHALLIGNVLVQAGALADGISIVREHNVPAIYTYYHLELDDHSLILADGVPAETFVDHVDRLAFDNWDEHEALYPQGKPIVEMEYPRVKAQRQLPRALRARLRDRSLTHRWVADARAA